MEKFKSFIAEEEKEKPYDLLIVSHDGIDDVNETGPLVKKTGKKMGLNVFLAETMGSYMEDDGDDKVFYSFPVSDKGEAQIPKPKDDVEYQKPFKINPDKTLIMMRGLHPIYGCESWNVMAQNLEKDGYKLINSVKCNEICNDKWFNYTVFQRENIQTPKSILIRHSEDALRAADKLGNKFPMILKTTVGSIGVGVMFVESAKSLSGIVQLLYRENKYIDILLQEYIKTDYDVRVIVVGGKVMGGMKRPIVKGDFRSNVSQGSEPEIHELTELEISESLRAAKAVGGDVVGVDFIPAKNRDKDKPFFIEVNSNPGLKGIEGVFSKKFSMTEKILTTYLNRDNWR
jgi:RimK family alpha-L-glutamate ligase|tara:strand:+ start:117 stop:1148 length:1032 start_codon:yes stop_codon:yes gene_type:complete